MARREVGGVAMLAAATLLLEGTLTRLLAVAQFYHFAFLAVSLALLGFGASGTLLSVAAPLRQMRPERLLLGCCAGFAACAGLAYAVVNLLPFDSYSIAWDRRQVGLFALYYLALTLPFLCGGLGIAAVLAAEEGRRTQVYAANLLGSAAGAGLALAVGWLAGVPGAVLVSAVIGFLPVLWLLRGRSRALRWAAATPVLVAAVGFAWLTASNLTERVGLGMTISPYKGLAHARRVPGAAALFGRWDAVARVDVIAGAGTRTLPGLSYAYAGLPPPQLGLARDADALQPITLASPAAFEAHAYLPEAPAFTLRPAGRVLILEPGAGLGVLQALAGDAQQIVAVVGSPLERRAVAATAQQADPFADPRVRTVAAPPRAFLAADRQTYDIVFLPLTDAYRPVTSGAYSLAETYGLTVEAFEASLARLAPRGVLVVTRWLQTPPSESLRLLATIAEALERRGLARPADAIVAYRGIQTITAIVCPAGWQADDLAALRAFLATRRYDLVWAPDVRAEETNRFNRLPRPADYEAAHGLFAATDRRAYYASYPFAVAPAADDRPFFFHFFRWGQTREVLASLGHTWQPFGGSGYLVLFALLGLVLLLSAGLIVLPLVIARGRGAGQGAGVSLWRLLIYFGGLGLAFLFVEIPLIQRYILLFGHATYAFSVVVVTLLLLASVGTQLVARAMVAEERRVRAGVRWIFPALVSLIVITALAGPRLMATALSWPLPGRLLAATAALAPLAVLMGMPFPLGLAQIRAAGPRPIAWAWAVNGCASVLASVLAAIGGLSWGFTAVILAGAVTYAVAGAVAPGLRVTRPASPTS